MQGEGRWTGLPVVFVRFAGCNLKCDFCDTNHHPYKEYTPREILREITAFAPCRHVVLTGGEPGLQVTQPFIDLLNENGFYIAIETNGTVRLPLGIHWVTCSPKFEFCPHADVRQDKIDELKVVYRGKGQDMSKYDGLAASFYYLQPCDTGDKAENELILSHAIEYIKNHPKWMLSLQTQKILNIR